MLMMSIPTMKGFAAPIRSLMLRGAIVSLLAVSSAARTQAQGDARPIADAPAPAAPPLSACVASLPDSVFTRVPVYAAVSMKDPLQRVPPAAANLAVAIVGRAELELHATPPVLAHGEPAITWRDLGGSLEVTWYRSGRVAWTISEDASSEERGRPAGIRLLARGLAAADSAGEAQMLWPDDLGGDSARLVVTLASPLVDSAGTVHPITAPLAVPAFSVAAPRETQVRVVRQPRKLSYPQRLITSGVEGRIILQFVVDTTGSPDTTTIRDLWPADKPRLEGALAGFYKEFFTAARRALATNVLAPATIGGCRVRQRVQQPFGWEIAR